MKWKHFNAVAYNKIKIEKHQLITFYFAQKKLKKMKKRLTMSNIFGILLMHCKKKMQMRKSSLKTEQNVNFEQLGNYNLLIIKN